MTNKTELLPCPFCYSDDVRITRDGGSDERCGYNFTYTASCGRCNARITVGSKHDKNGWCNEGDDSAKRRCADHWNTRAAPAEDVRAVVDAPVAEYQVRTRSSDREGDEGWCPWERCSEFNYADYVRVPVLHGWEYQTRKLYSHPPRPVVMPQRESLGYLPGHEAIGWNACIDEFARLNPGIPK